MINPDIVKCEFVNVVVEIKGTYTYGATVCDMEGITGRPANVNVATMLDFDKFWDLMIDALASY